jgi:hypothetical protein
MMSTQTSFFFSDHFLAPEQQALVNRPVHGDIVFLEGAAGTGKTTVAAARLRHLLEQGVPAEEILVLVPQRTHLEPFLSVLRSAKLPPGGSVNTLTMGGLAWRMVSLFWPLVAERAGFDHPDQPPVFLNLETSQYYMARIADPMMEAGAFEEIAIDRNRILSQILDNLNKAALMGLDHTEVGERLEQAWTGSSARAAVYERAQQCANEFRAYCLAHNLLDFSLLIEVFVKHLLTLPWPPGEGFMRRFTRYQHLIIDNLEENIPVTHNLMRSWLAQCDSALLIYDRDAGYRVFLGADPKGALSLREAARHRAELHHSFVTPPYLQAFAHELAYGLGYAPPAGDGEPGDMRQALTISENVLRFHPQMLDWVAGKIAELVHEKGVAPGEIVVIGPVLSDALRFSLSERLGRLGVPSRSHRPSRALREEPATRCLLTLAALAHPEWDHAPLQADVVDALTLAIESLDPVRAQLLASIVYRPGSSGPSETGFPLTPFGDLKASVQERIGYDAGNRYDALRSWLEGHAQTGAPPAQETGRRRKRGAKDPKPPLDHLFSRLFGEVLSQPGYGLHEDMQAGRIVAQLIDSARSFRQVVDRPSLAPSHAIGLEYVRMVERGVIAAQYIPAWRAEEEEDAVLLAPIYTFLLRNRPVDYQFWLNVGGSRWWDRLYQPLTHPYVLTPHWRPGDLWTDADEEETRTETLHQVVQGLVRRCRVRIYLGINELGEHGFEQRGRLLQAIQGSLRRRGIHEVWGDTRES